MPSDWDRLQERALSSILAAFNSGHTEVCATAPTGFGKTKLAEMFIRRCESKGYPWVLYTHRKMLFQQAHSRFLRNGVQHGCRASGYDQALLKSGQLAMLQSEQAAIKSESRELHAAKVVLWDECHQQKAGFAENVFRHHQDRKCMQLGLTATPVNVGHLYKHLVPLAVNSELRGVGGLLLADTYAPDEVDLSDITKKSGQEYSAKELGRRFREQQVVGSIFDHYRQLNPQQLPTLVFAPDVKSSIWLADYFLDRGVSAAHIDGEKIYLGERDENGEPVVFRSTQDQRDDLAARSESGEIKVVCNRFVMREGVDWPWLGCGIFATTFGTEDGWVQAGGRILRAHHSLSRVIVIDHGGNWWRWGSLNADRTWELSDTSVSREKELKEQQQTPDADTNESTQDLSCPVCKRVIKRDMWRSDRKCPYCGHQFRQGTRAVWQTDGTLKKIRGDAVKLKRKPKSGTTAEAQKAWNSMFFPSYNSKRPRSSTFNQLRARFEKAHPEWSVVCRQGQTCLVGPGGIHVLKNAPPPGSGHWSMEVRRTARGSLQ